MLTYPVKILLYTFAALLLFITSVSNTAYAAPPANCTKSFLGIPYWYEYVPLNADCTVNTAAVNAGTLTILIFMGIFDILMYLAGLLAVIFVIYGGFQFLTSVGEPQKIAGARKTILNAIIGLVLAIVASQLVGFIAGRLNS